MITEISYYIEQTKYGTLLTGFILAPGSDWDNVQQWVYCCGIFGYDEKCCLNQLRQQFPKINFISCGEVKDNFYFEILKDASKRTDRTGTSFELGTDFQQKVWKEVVQIPYGQTANYSEIAERIGNPKAFRAVASAIAQNPLALIVPCHRILPKDGSVGKYRWGIKMKQELLNQEQNV